MSESPHVAVIGAGPAGITAAYQLAKAGVKVELFEAADSVGGMAKTIALWGQRVDLGPHRFFSKDPRVNGLWLELVGRDYAIVNRLSRIYYNHRFFNYPLEAVNALRGLGIVEAIRCMASYVFARLHPKKDTSSFENWVINRFGARLFSIFFKSYSEKLWGIGCDALDADFAAQRIKKFSLQEAVKNALSKNNKHMTLIDQFAYPHHGSGIVYERMAKRIEELGGKVHLNTAVKAVRVKNLSGGTAIELANGESRSFTHIISTMPLTLMVASLNAPENIRAHASALRFRNTILVYLEIKGSDLFPDQWIYIHAPELETGRITNFRNWTHQLYGDSPNTIISMEYWCYDDDPIWKEQDASLIARATNEAYATTLIPQGSVLQGKVVRIPKCYPVYAHGYKEHLKPIEDYLSQFPDVSIIGRYGAFKYNNQDHSILMGMLASENIAHGATHNLWGINTDYEYQESSIITETGLQKI